MRTRAGCVEIPRRCAARNDTLSARQALRERMQMIVTIDRAGTARSVIEETLHATSIQTVQSVG